jgi:hypothetical protein
MPKLQLNKYAPTAGGSVATIFAVHCSTEFVYSWKIKSLGSTGNNFPPIENVSVWASEHGKLVPIRRSISVMTSSGPLMSEFP